MIERQDLKKDIEIEQTLKSCTEKQCFERKVYQMVLANSSDCKANALKAVEGRPRLSIGFLP